MIVLFGNIWYPFKGNVGEKMNTANIQIVTPIVSRQREDILNDVRLLNTKAVDCIEWRADYYENVSDLSKVLSLLKEIAAINKQQIIFTYRSTAEGGQGNLQNTAEYLVLIKSVILTKNIDYVDIELLLGNTFIETIKNHAQLCNVKLIISNHDFDSTPRLDSIVSRFKKIEEIGGDIAVGVYTPKTKEDVETLKEACQQLKDLAIPYVAIALTELGKETRVHPEAYGSCMVFVSVTEKSAPGQITLEEYTKKKDMPN